MHSFDRGWNVSGFTLVELLVVVAVLGILSSLTVTGYQRSVSKSRQAEAKLALTAVFAGQRAFYAEFTAYAPSFYSIGYEPEGFRRFYAVGWRDGPWGQTITGYSGAFGNYSYNRLNTPSVVGFHNSCNSASADGFLSSMTAAPFNQNDPQSFTVRAAGNLRFDTPCDVWEINELKRLQNLTISL